MGEFIKAAHGNEQFCKARPFINSLVWKLKLAVFHKDQIIKISAEYFPDDNLSSQYDAGVHFNERMRTYLTSDILYWAKLETEANFLGCSQSLHSMPDILAKVIYYSLALSSKIPDNLYQLTSKNSLPTDIKVAVDSFKNSDEYKYLRAYVNKTKHEQVVLTQDTVNFDSGERGLLINAFDWKDRNLNQMLHFPRQKLGKWVSSDFEKILSLIDDIGLEINSSLAIDV